MRRSVKNCVPIIWSVCLSNKPLWKLLSTCLAGQIIFAEIKSESLKIILDVNNDIKVVSLAENGRKVLDLLKKTLPDVIFMDIRMLELDGVQCTKAVRS